MTRVMLLSWYQAAIITLDEWNLCLCLLLQPVSLRHEEVTMFTSLMKSHGVYLLIVGLFLILANRATAQTDETILVHSKCESRNLTVSAGSPSSGEVEFRYKGNASGIPVGLDRSNKRTISKINDYFKASATTGDEAVVAVCNGTTLFDEITAFLYSCPSNPVGFGYPIDCSRITASSSLIRASAGGSVSLPDGTHLEIPPGALAVDTQISLFGVPLDLVQDPSLLAMVEISPDGLQLQKSGTLTFNYDPTLLSPSDDALAYSFDRSAPPLIFGPELSITEPLGIVASDQALGILSANITHFSSFFANKTAHAELVTEIPLQFLRKGDILIQLSNCGNQCDFSPGHAAMYLGTKDPLADASDGSTIIEAGGGPVQFSLPTGLPSDFGSGSSAAFSFNKDYMGARTPTNHAMVDTERTTIAQFAISKIGTPYSLIGFLNNSGETCSGLVAQSYFKAGISLGLTSPATLQRAAATTPWGIMHSTTPVQNITVNVGTSVVVPVKAMVGIFTTSTFPLRVYQRNPGGTSITASNLPGGATFLPNGVGGETFSWTPAPSDAGKLFSIQFTATGPFSGTVSNQLNVLVPAPVKFSLLSAACVAGGGEFTFSVTGFVGSSFGYSFCPVINTCGSWSLGFDGFCNVCIRQPADDVTTTISFTTNFVGTAIFAAENGGPLCTPALSPACFVTQSNLPNPCGP